MLGILRFEQLDPIPYALWANLFVISLIVLAMELIPIICGSGQEKTGDGGDPIQEERV